MDARYPVIIKQWRSAWEQFTPFLSFPPEIRRVVYTSNAIESLNARFRQATRRRDQVPNDQAERLSDSPSVPRDPRG
jgi:putative transposase